MIISRQLAVRRDDPRIVRGARCTWWDGIMRAGKKPRSFWQFFLQSSIPCCPHCGGVLFEVAIIGEWNSILQQHENEGRPGYRAMVEWGRGQCFRDFDQLEKAYNARTDETRCA